jgi:PAS domain S-box-containing protein
LEIDALVKVDDGPALEAMKVLDGELFLARQSSAKTVFDTVHSLNVFATRTAIITTLVLVLLSAAILWFARWRILIPLRNLDDAIKRIDPRSPSKMRLPTREGVKGDELDHLARTGNAFIHASEVHLKRFRMAEGALKSSEAHLRAIVESAVDAIVTIDQEGIILSFNTAAIQMFSYSEEETIGQNVKILMPEPYKREHDGYLSRYLKTAKSAIIGVGREVTGQRKDGSVFPMRLGISEVSSGDKKSFTGIIRDLSAEKEAELKLRMAKQAADKANQAKSEFLASMSHELRTPLNAILGFSQLIESSPSEPITAKQQEYISLVIKSGDYLLELIEEVLELSKIEAGEMTVHIETIDTEELIKESLDIVSSRAGGAHISIDCLPLGNVPNIFADLTRVKQVLLNLLSNAVKYNRDGGSVIIKCREVPNDHLRITVVDTGIGIPEEKQKDLFKPFNRLGLESSGIEGCGIGLAITKRILEAMDGKIGYTSEEGVGSSFWFELPVA